MFSFNLRLTRLQQSSYIMLNHCCPDQLFNLAQSVDLVQMYIIQKTSTHTVFVTQILSSEGLRRLCCTTADCRFELFTFNEAGCFRILNWNCRWIGIFTGFRSLSKFVARSQGMFVEKLRRQFVD